MVHDFLHRQKNVEGIFCDAFDVFCLIGTLSRLFAVQALLPLLPQAEEQAAGHVPQGDHHQPLQGLARGLIEDPGDRPVIHVRHAVLHAADDEHRDPQEDGQVLAQLVGVVGIAVHRREDAHVAQEAQQEETQQGGVHLGGHQGVGGDVDPRLRPADAGDPLHAADEHGANQVARPDDEQVDEVARPGVIEEIAGLAGEQVVSPGADGEKADGKEEGPHHIAAGKGVL